MANIGKLSDLLFPKPSETVIIVECPVLDEKT